MGIVEGKDWDHTMLWLCAGGLTRALDVLPPPSGESIERSLKIAERMEPPSPFVAPVVLNLKGGSSPIDAEVFNGSNVIDWLTDERYLPGR